MLVILFRNPVSDVSSFTLQNFHTLFLSNLEFICIWISPNLPSFMGRIKNFPTHLFFFFVNNLKFLILLRYQNYLIIEVDSRTLPCKSVIFRVVEHYYLTSKCFKRLIHLTVEEKTKRKLYKI